MTVDTELLQAEMPAGDQLTEVELSRANTLISSVLDDVRLGAEYPGFTVAYDAATNTAHWKDTHDTIEATASSQDGTGILRITQKLWDEAGHDAVTTSVSITGSEGRMTRSKIRNNGLVLEPERTAPLDRATYDTTLENLVNLKRFDTQEPVQPQRRRLRPGWLRALLGR